MSNPRQLFLDNDFIQDPKIQILMIEFGEVAIGRYIHLLTRLNDEGGSMPLKHVRVLGHQIGVSKDEWISFVDFCVQEELFEQDPEYIYHIRLVADSKSLKKKQETWRNNKRKNKDSQEILNGISKESPHTYIEKEQEEEEEKEQEKEKELEKEGKRKILDFLYFDEISEDGWKCKLGIKGFERACEKLNGWIGQAKGSPEFQKRLLAGQNAAFTLQNWVSQAVSNESNARGSPNKKNQQTFEEIEKELDERGIF
jgi:hypothetical protein